MPFSISCSIACSVPWPSFRASINPSAMANSPFL
jgi:hypothetical protein